MVKQSDRLDSVFGAIADATRRAMLRQLAQGPRTVSELAEPHAMSLAAASKHIKLLERAGLLQRSVQGRIHVCSLDAQPLHAGVEWLRHYEQFWNARLDTLESLLAAEDAPTKATTKRSTNAKAANPRASTPGTEKRR